MKISYMLKASISIFLFLCISLSSYSFRLDNISFNQRVDSEDGGYRESYIINNSLRKERYKINILPGNDNDGSKFVEVYPKVITVDPKGKGIVKIYMKTPTNLPQGEYYFKLQFKPIIIPTLAKNETGKINGTSNINIAPVVEMKGYVGEVDFSESIKIEDIQIKKNKNGKGIILMGNMSNDSFAGIDFGIEYYGSNNYFYGSVTMDDLAANTKTKKFEVVLENIQNPNDLKQIILYRTPSNKREIIKKLDVSKFNVVKTSN